MADYVIAKYIRLSVDDGITESLSIPNQRLLLDKHIDSLDIPNATILEFIDNGKTGVNFERPAVHEMLELVRAGKINCIICKDFTRFGRNTLEMGYLIEQVFPLFRMRFITVGDYFDSNNFKNSTGGIDVAFKLLMGEHYSRDLSQKVKSVKRMQMARGENIVANSIYGYGKSKTGKWEPEEPAASVVREIFTLAIEGVPTTKIKDMMFQKGYPTPREYMELKRGKEILPTCHWETRAIARMLTNEQYIGTYVAGKQNSKAIGSHSKVWVDKDDWIVIPDSHTPIIEKAAFVAVQALIEKQLKRNTTAKPIEHSWQEGDKYSRSEKMKEGKWITAAPIFGYTKMADGFWSVDVTASKIVQKIFELAIGGATIHEIKDLLTAEQVPTPLEYIRANRGYTTPPTCVWNAKNVRNILKNVQYTGAYVSGRIVKNYATGKKYHTSETDWVVIPNKHPALVSNGTYEQVQAILTLKKDGKCIRRPRNYLLRGKVVCGCCSMALMYDLLANPVFRCYQTHADPSAACHKLKIVASELDELVITLIKKQAEAVLATSDFEQIKKQSKTEMKIATCESELADCNLKRQKYYERFITGELEREDYLKLKAQTSEQAENLKSILEKLKAEVAAGAIREKTKKVAKELLDPKASEKEIVETMVDKVMVFPGNRVEIRWRVADFSLGV